MRKINFELVSAQALGQWPQILTGLDIDPSHLKNKHGPCPGCGGSDRFRFDDKAGRGTFICGHGSSGDGFMLLEHVYQWDRKESLRQVATWLGIRSGDTLSQEDIVKADQRFKKFELARTDKRDKELAVNRQKARQLWNQASKCIDHEYLQMKGVEAFGVRVHNNELLVPLCDGAGQLQNLQRIYKTTIKGKTIIKKRFLGPGVTGYFHLIGHLPAKDIFICEGYATACSVHQATKKSVIVAFNAGNLLSTARCLCGLHPDARIIIAADNDQFKEKNAGLEKAQEAASAVNGYVVIPRFTEGLDYGTEHPSDWNDRVTGEGLELVSAAIDAQLRKFPTSRSSKKTTTQEPDKETVKGEYSTIDKRFGPFVNSVTGINGGHPGVYFSPPDDSGSAWICGPLHVVARTRDEEASNWGLLLRFADHDMNDKEWNVPATALADGYGNELVKTLMASGLGVGSGLKAKQRLLEYVQCASPDKRAKLVYSLGWHGKAFLWPDGTVAGTSSEKLIGQHQSRSVNPASTRGTVDEWREHVSRLCHQNHRLVFAVSASFASPLLHWARMSTGGFHWHGASSLGKSTLLYAAASVFGLPENENGADYVKNWRITSNAIENIAKAFSGFPLLLDEIKQIDSRIVQETVYTLGNGTGKSRLTDSCNLQAVASWLLLYQSTGEKTLAEHMAEINKKPDAGAEIRMIGIPADAQKGLGIYDTIHGLNSSNALAVHLKKVTHMYYGSAGRAFIENVVQDIDSIKHSVSEFIEAFRCANVAPDANSQVGRVADFFALAAYAGELATQFGITGWDKGEAEQSAKVCFEAWLKHRGGTRSHEDIEALKQVQNFFEENGESRFSWLDRAEDNHSSSTVSRCGYRVLDKVIGETTYYVFTERFRSEICRGLKNKRVTELLEAAGALEPSPSRKQQQKRLPGRENACWVYVINSKVYSIAEKIEEENKS